MTAHRGGRRHPVDSVVIELLDRGGEERMYIRTLGSAKPYEESWSIDAGSVEDWALRIASTLALREAPRVFGVLRQCADRLGVER